ncbi:hypothetical protein WN55_02639 [Dufourea novaeangliae]|uniref:Uncharacterized protein n=1 Tax=Dufourea novaeangliae TaxID=178035 RepID=A0A154PJ05_DUFNO|nr:hypothetical protein WN55_02639 [Dufourea novaeangliae]
MLAVGTTAPVALQVVAGGFAIAPFGLPKLAACPPVVSVVHPGTPALEIPGSLEPVEAYECRVLGIRRPSVKGRDGEVRGQGLTQKPSSVTEQGRNRAARSAESGWRGANGQTTGLKQAAGDRIHHPCREGLGNLGRAPHGVWSPGPNSGLPIGSPPSGFGRSGSSITSLFGD